MIDVDGSKKGVTMKLETMNLKLKKVGLSILTLLSLLSISCAHSKHHKNCCGAEKKSECSLKGEGKDCADCKHDENAAPAK